MARNDTAVRQMKTFELKARRLLLALLIISSHNVGIHQILSFAFLSIEPSAARITHRIRALITRSVTFGDAHRTCRQRHRRGLLL
jgi:hypothetical protein